jgi:large subunit ribosomal protein L21e
MVRRSTGLRRRTRRKLKKKANEKFKVTSYLQKFEPKDTVVIKLDPASQKGMPHPMFKGKTGRVVERRGNAYIVEITYGNKKKMLIARPEHLALKK